MCFKILEISWVDYNVEVVAVVKEHAKDCLIKYKLN
jgi:hypothetical protein